MFAACNKTQHTHDTPFETFVLKFHTLQTQKLKTTVAKTVRFRSKIGTARVSRGKFLPSEVSSRRKIRGRVPWTSDSETTKRKKKTRRYWDITRARVSDTLYTARAITIIIIIKITWKTTKTTTIIIIIKYKTEKAARTNDPLWLYVIYAYLYSISGAYLDRLSCEIRPTYLCRYTVEGNKTGEGGAKKKTPNVMRTRARVS